MTDFLLIFTFVVVLYSFIGYSCYFIFKYGIDTLLLSSPSSTDKDIDGGHNLSITLSLFWPISLPVILFLVMLISLYVLIVILSR